MSRNSSININQDTIGSIINTGKISNSTIIQVSSATKSTFGFELYTLDYFKNHKSTEKDIEYWKNGFPFKLEAIKEKLEFRRSKVIDKIETKLETRQNLLIVGESGTSKSTILKEIVCDYVDMGYFVLYNDGREITNSDLFIQFVEGLIKSGKKVLIAADDAHNVETVAIFYALDKFSNYELKENLRFILAARLPDFDFFLEKGLCKIPQTYAESIRELTGEATVDIDFRFELPAFSEKDIAGFIKKYGNSAKLILNYGYLGIHTSGELSDGDVCKISKRIMEDTKGIAVLVRFLVVGQGLHKDVEDRYNRYLAENSDEKTKKIQTMLVCSLLEAVDFSVTDELLEMIDFPIKDNLSEKKNFHDVAITLDGSTLYWHSGVWSTLHRKWNLEFLSFMFNKNSKIRLHENRKHLWNAVKLVFLTGNEKAVIAIVHSLIGFDSNLYDKIDSPKPFFYSLVPLEEVGLKIRSFIDDSLCRFSPQTISKIWYWIGLAWNNRGYYLEALKPAAALECYNKAIQANPNSSYLWSKRADLLERLKNS